MRVSVYRNLRHGRQAPPLYSILGPEGRVMEHRHRVLLTNCTFVVRPAGRRRVLLTGVKNVHAFVRGYLVDDRGAFGMDANDPHDLPVKLKYNPSRSDRFLVAEGPQENMGVKRARGVLLNERGISACYIDEWHDNNATSYGNTP